MGGGPLPVLSMWCTDTGRVADDLYILGTHRNPVFLLGRGRGVDARGVRRSIEQVQGLDAHGLIPGHHGRLAGESAARAPRQALQGLEAFASRAMERAPSEAFVPEELHRKSMLRVLELMGAEGYLDVSCEAGRRA
jgi:hypothetical protein